MNHSNVPSFGHCNSCGEFAVNGLHTCPATATVETLTEETSAEAALMETLIDRHGKEWTVRLRRPDGSIFTLSKGGWYEGRGEGDQKLAAVRRPADGGGGRAHRAAVPRGRGQVMSSSTSFFEQALEKLAGRHSSDGVPGRGAETQIPSGPKRPGQRGRRKS